MPLQNVHIRVNDAATGKPTPVRLRVTEEAGHYFAPFGHAAEFPAGRAEAVGGDVLTNGERWAYIDGACEMAAPAGRLNVAISKGPQFQPIRETVELPPGKMALRFAIQRLHDWRADGWQSGDLRVHTISPHAALLEAGGEDLDFVHILASPTHLLAADGNTYAITPNLEAFSGQTTALQRDGHAVVVGTQNIHPVLGTLGLHHCHRIVFPLTFGGADATDDWSLGDWCDQCHRKKGLVVWTGATTSPLAGAEALAHAILGHIDALELTADVTEPLRVWRQLLDCGVRLPIVGSSAKNSNAVATGECRTWAKIQPDEPAEFRTWIEAIRAGRTVVSRGPLVPLTVDGEPPGSTLERSEGRTVEIESADRAQIVWNGAVVGKGRARLAVQTSGWLAARIITEGFAHTSPVWIDVPGRPMPRNEQSAQVLRRKLAAGREWIEREGRFEKQQSRRQQFDTFDSAIRKLDTAAE